MDVASTQWQRSESLKQSFTYLPRSPYVYEVAATNWLRCRYVHVTLTTPLLRPDSAKYSLRFFEHFQSSTTSFTSRKTLLHFYRFLQRSYYVLQVPIFKDVVRISNFLRSNVFQVFGRSQWLLWSYYDVLHRTWQFIKQWHIMLKYQNLSHCMRFPTMWYVRPAKPQISLRIRAVWSEPLLVTWLFYDC